MLRGTQVASIALPLALVCAFLVCPVYAQATIPQLRGSGNGGSQVLVFDAGSSGTRIHIFNILTSSKGSHVPRIDLSVRDAQTLKLKPGLSHYANSGDLTGAAQSIRGLLDFAAKFVAPERRGRTPALLKATAGLRAVPAEKAEAVLGVVRSTLETSEYEFNHSWAGIIPGIEEAALAWVTANYFEGTFDAATNGPAETGSIGVIEMGGGSTQVAFQIDKGSEVVESDHFTFKTAMGKEYHVYAHSYLGYGQDHAQAKLLELLPADNAQDPCYPEGYQRKGAEAIGTVSGTGNAKACQEKIDALLLDSTHDSAPGRYVHEPPLRGRFVATENFFYVRNDLNLPLIGETTAMEAAATEHCKTVHVATAAEQEAMTSGSADISQPKHCFSLSYHVAMLRALKVPSTPGVDLQIVRQIKGSDVDWAVGAALVHHLMSGPVATPSDSTGNISIVDGDAFKSENYIIRLVCFVFLGLAVATTVLRKGFGKINIPSCPKAH